MSGLFSKPKVAMPEIKPPTPMPDEVQTDSARRRRVAKEKAGAGVQSTILTQAAGRETLGG